MVKYDGEYLIKNIKISSRYFEWLYCSCLASNVGRYWLNEMVYKIAKEGKTNVKFITNDVIKIK